jgi:BASS family bile acid:Na+ symporter
MIPLDSAINLLAALTLIEMMVTIGLGVTFGDVLDVARNRGVVVRAALANYVVVPAVAVALLLLFRTQPLVAAGFLIAAVCPGAPYGPPFTAMAKGQVVLSVGLMVILAASSAVIAPLLLQVLLPLVTGSQPLNVNVVKLVATLAVSQLLPLCVGLFLRQRRPALADKLKGPFIAVSKVLNLLLIGVILVVQFRMLVGIRPIAYVGMLALVGATFLAGWLVAGWDKQIRKSLAITTSVRNVGVSLVIVTGSFPGTPAISASTAYALFQTVVMALVAIAWGRLTAAREPAAATVGS